MGTLWTVHLIIAFLTVTLTSTMPHHQQQQQTTSRTPQQIGETIKVLTNQLMETNITSSDVVLDTRTPPRVRQQTRREKIEEPVENSHPGIAVPVDEETILLDEPTKKLHFYKVDKPTTDSGLSTWILLSGHTSSPTSTAKTSRKPPIKQTHQNLGNMTIFLADTPNKNLKAVFKKKPATSTTTSTTNVTEKTTTTTTTAATITTKKSSFTTPVGLLTKLTAASMKPDKTTKLTKVKASILNNAVNNKTKPNNSMSSTKKPLTTPTAKTSTTITTTKMPNKKVELIKVSDSNSNNVIKTNSLPLEAKDDEIDLNSLTTTTTNPKKSRRPGSKRKKNKNRRKRPTSIDRNDVSNATNTKVTTSSKEKPIGTQIYNYLSREVMPTVGVGLVGLMVTAGLASYFLYPFGGLRRSYDIDRKDKDASHYYRNDYTGGIAEEDAIGKVIAGMPSFSNYNSYSSKNNNPITKVLNSNVRYRHVDHRYSQPQGSVETVKIEPDYNNNNNKQEEVIVQNMYVPQETYNHHYSKEVMNEKKDDGKQFVVGNVPKEYLDEATPIAVPEHGPRSMKLRRRRRRQVDYNENDIFSDDPLNQNVVLPMNVNTPSFEQVTTTATTKFIPKLSETTTTTMSSNFDVQPPEQPVSFFDLFKDILHLKIKMGLELLQNTTETISKYITRIQKRVEERTKLS